MKIRLLSDQIFRRDDTSENAAGGPSEQNLAEMLVVVAVKSYLKRAARDLDLKLTAVTLSVEMCGYGTCHGTRPAGEGLSFHTPFVGADPDLSMAFDLGEVGIGAAAGCKPFGIADFAPSVLHVNRCYVWYKLHIVRDSRVEEERPVAEFIALYVDHAQFHHSFIACR